MTPSQLNENNDNTMSCYYFRVGKCKFGDKCKNLHSEIETNNNRSTENLTLSFAQVAAPSEAEAASIQRKNQTIQSFKPSNEKSSSLCPFAMVGKCKFGPVSCRNTHGIQCPRCLQYCLHPTDLDGNEAHFEECLGKNVHLEPSELAKIECGICLACISTKEDPRFGLMSCDHAFCLKCIRTWRSQHKFADLTTKSCPLCRQITYFVVPSSTWISDEREKKRVIYAYKVQCSKIPCKYLSIGTEECPFGGSCFYSHIKTDGTTAGKSNRRIYVDSEEKARLLEDPKLSDFIDYLVGKLSLSPTNTPLQ